MSAGRPEQKAEDLREAMFVIGRAARAASRELALASTATKNAAFVRDGGASAAAECSGPEGQCG